MSLPMSLPMTHIEYLNSQLLKEKPTLLRGGHVSHDHSLFSLFSSMCLGVVGPVSCWLMSLCHRRYASLAAFLKIRLGNT